MMERVRKALAPWWRWRWQLACAALTIGWALTAWTNSNLRERNRLLGRVVAIQEDWCDGLGQVNLACESTLTEMAIRLGLAADYLPLVTTALWQRAMHNTSVRQARRTLGAPSTSRGVLEDPRAAMGGPSEDEEAAVQKAAKGKKWKR
jgi:hypothetical protein